MTRTAICGWTAIVLFGIVWAVALSKAAEEAELRESATGETRGDTVFRELKVFLATVKRTGILEHVEVFEETSDDGKSMAKFYKCKMSVRKIKLIDIERRSKNSLLYDGWADFRVDLFETESFDTQGEAQSARLRDHGDELKGTIRVTLAYEQHGWVISASEHRLEDGSTDYDPYGQMWVAAFGGETE